VAVRSKATLTPPRWWPPDTTTLARVATPAGAVTLRPFEEADTTSRLRWSLANARRWSAVHANHRRRGRFEGTTWSMSRSPGSSVVARRRSTPVSGDDGAPDRVDLSQRRGLLDKCLLACSHPSSSMSAQWPSSPVSTDDRVKPDRHRQAGEHLLADGDAPTLAGYGGDGGRLTCRGARTTADRIAATHAEDHARPASTPERCGRYGGGSHDGPV